jgi:hypothetical protein
MGRLLRNRYSNQQLHVQIPAIVDAFAAGEIDCLQFKYSVQNLLRKIDMLAENKPALSKLTCARLIKESGSDQMWAQMVWLKKTYQIPYDEIIAFLKHLDSKESAVGSE